MCAPSHTHTEREREKETHTRAQKSLNIRCKVPLNFRTMDLIEPFVKLELGLGVELCLIPTSQEEPDQ